MNRRNMGSQKKRSLRPHTSLSPFFHGINVWSYKQLGKQKQQQHPKYFLQHFICHCIFAIFRRLILVNFIHFGWNESNKCRFHVFKLLVLLFLFYRCSLLRPFKIIIAILATTIATSAAAAGARSIIYLFHSIFFAFSLTLSISASGSTLNEQMWINLFGV